MSEPNASKVIVGVRSPGAYRPELESLRGWAIALVVLFHYHGILFGNAPLPPDRPLWRSLMAAGNTGVTLFFVLSGFLLAQPFLHSLQGGPKVDVGRFYRARILRVVPLYYLAVLVAWLLSGNWLALKGLLFIPLGSQVFPYSVPWWSLSTEVQFYLLLPLLMLPWCRKQGGYWVVVGLLVWLLAYLYLFHQPQWLNTHTTLVWQSSLFGRAPAFLGGIAAAWLLRTTPGKHLFAWQPLAWGLLLGGGVCSWRCGIGRRA